MRLRTAFLFATICTATSANAALTVIGQGPAHDCYVAALHDYGAAGGEDICSLALDSAPLNLRDRAATLVNRGVIRTRLGRLEAALSDDDQAVAIGRYLSPSDLGVAYVNRASVLNGLGRPREAFDSANKGLSLGAANPAIGYYDRAVAEEMLGDIKAAYHDYKQAIGLDPNFTPAARQLTRFRVDGRPAEQS